MSLANPDKREREWLDRISRMPCIVCVNEGFGNTPAVVHHMIEGGRRLGHLYTIPLCHPHHGQGLNTRLCVSRHPFRREWERRYGTERELWEKTRELINKGPA